VHGIVAAGRLPVERRDAAAGGIDGEGVGLGSVAMHGIEPRARRIDREEGGILKAAEMLDVRERARATVDTIDVDAVARAVPFGRRVAADIGKQGSGRAGRVFHPSSVAAMARRDNVRARGYG
jgi:hypothetical protein